MWNKPVDELGTQSLPTNLIPAVPDKYLVKLNPPKICVVYHYKGHNPNDQFWRDIPLDKHNTAIDLTDWLFKAHSYYFDNTVVKKSQVQ